MAVGVIGRDTRRRFAGLARQVERVMGRHFNTGAVKALALETLFAFRSLKSSMESQQADDISDSDSNENTTCL
jgi:hypothetical protein